jgi:hypothetical protein
VEVRAGREPRLLEQGDQALARGAGVGRRLEDHELAGLEDTGQRAGGVHERAEVGLAVAGQRCGDRDQDRLRAGQVGIASRGLDALRRGGDARVGDILDVGAPRAQRLDLARLEVDAHHLDALLGEGDGEREADVAEADDADGHGRPV